MWMLFFRRIHILIHNFNQGFIIELSGSRGTDGFWSAGSGGNALNISFNLQDTGPINEP